MKTPNLLDVPKTGLTRREKWNAFKAKHGIETHNAGWSREDHPWSACLMPVARKVGYGVTEESSLFDCVAKACRLLEEAGYLVTGRTEREAIRRLCDENNIPCEL